MWWSSGVVPGSAATIGCMLVLAESRLRERFSIATIYPSFVALLRHQPPEDWLMTHSHRFFETLDKKVCVQASKCAMIAHRAWWVSDYGRNRPLLQMIPGGLMNRPHAFAKGLSGSLHRLFPALTGNYQG